MVADGNIESCHCLFYLQVSNVAIHDSPVATSTSQSFVNEILRMWQVDCKNNEKYTTFENLCL